jgi:hypothetical protein
VPGSYEEVDGAFAFATRLDAVEQSLKSLPLRLNSLEEKLAKSADTFTSSTLESLQANSDQLSAFASRIDSLECVLSLPLTKQTLVIDFASILDTRLAAVNLEVVQLTEGIRSSLESKWEMRLASLRSEWSRDCADSNGATSSHRFDALVSLVTALQAQLFELSQSHRSMSNSSGTIKEIKVGLDGLGNRLALLESTFGPDSDAELVDKVESLESQLRSVEKLFTEKLYSVDYRLENKIELLHDLLTKVPRQPQYFHRQPARPLDLPFLRYLRRYMNSPQAMKA